MSDALHRVAALHEAARVHPSERAVVVDDACLRGSRSKLRAAFCGRLYRSWDAAAVAARLRRFEVPLDLPFGRLSKGQKGLVALALALGHSPEVLILDDPTLGLDVAARRALYEELVGDLADRGTTVLVTTHDLAGVEGIADRVGILHAGRLVVDDALEALKERHAVRSAALEEIFLAVTA